MSTTNDNKNPAPAATTANEAPVTAEATTLPEVAEVEAATATAVVPATELVEATVEGDNPSVSLTPEMQAHAQELRKNLTSGNRVNPHKYITSVGKEELNRLKTLSKALDTPISNMTAPDTKEGSVSNTLIDLKVQVEGIDPGQVDMSPGMWGRFMQMITGSSAVNKYFTKFQTTRSVIDSIVRSLEQGKVILEEDNIIFEQDKGNYRLTSKDLQNKIYVLTELERLIEQDIETSKDQEEIKFLKEEVLFSIRQHLIDLEQTLVVTGQGVIAIGMLVKNNNELIRGVDRAINVTVSALSIGATIMIGLTNQKKVMEKTKAVNDATNNMILSTSKMLKEQGAEIQKEAASSTLDLSILQEAVRNAIDAVEDVEKFKQEALPDMKKSIAELRGLNEIVETKVIKMEKAEAIALPTA